MLTPVLGGDFRPQLEPVSKICSFSIDLRYVVFFISLKEHHLILPPQKKKRWDFRKNGSGDQGAWQLFRRRGEGGQRRAASGTIGGQSIPAE